MEQDHKSIAYLETFQNFPHSDYNIEGETPESVIEKIIQKLIELGLSNEVCMLVLWTPEFPEARVFQFHSSGELIEIHPSHSPQPSTS